MDKDQRNELIALSIGWLVVVVFQYFFCDAAATYISQHWITDGAIANSADWLARFLTVVRDKFFLSFCIGISFYFVIIFTSQGWIEFAGASFVTVIVGAFLSSWPYFTKTGQTNWDVPIFFLTCVPTTAVAWKYLYKWFPRDKDTDVKMATVAANLKAKSPKQALVEEAKELKKENKPVEQPPVPPKEPPAEPTQEPFWRID